MTKITKHHIDMAALHARLGDACEYLQDLMGVTDGGLAGMVFADIDDDWSDIREADRIARLNEYVELETRFAARALPRRDEYGRSAQDRYDEEWGTDNGFSPWDNQPSASEY